MAICKECNEKILFSEDKYYCSNCGKRCHLKCLANRYIETGWIIEFLTGKQYRRLLLCDKCCKEWDKKHD